MLHEDAVQVSNNSSKTGKHDFLKSPWSRYCTSLNIYLLPSFCHSIKYFGLHKLRYVVDICWVAKLNLKKKKTRIRTSQGCFPWWLKKKTQASPLPRRPVWYHQQMFQKMKPQHYEHLHFAQAPPTLVTARPPPNRISCGTESAGMGHTSLTAAMHPPDAVQTHTERPHFKGMFQPRVERKSLFTEYHHPRFSLRSHMLANFLVN